MRVLLADDHRLVVEGLGNMLAAHGIEVVGVANDGLEAVELALALRPDLILMDLRMPRCTGLEATRRIKARQPEIKVVILTTSAEDQDLFESVKAGAGGYLLKSMSGEEFIQALRGLEQGIPPFSPGLAARLLSEFAKLSEPKDPSVPPASLVQKETPASELTERQLEVLRLVAAGFTYQEVGKRLSLSERTVRFHMTEIMNRLHLRNRAQVLAYAGKLDLKLPD